MIEFGLRAAGFPCSTPPASGATETVLKYLVVSSRILVRMATSATRKEVSVVLFPGLEAETGASGQKSAGQPE
jgi:hypothetical protein